MFRYFSVISRPYVEAMPAKTDPSMFYDVYILWVGLGQFKSQPEEDLDI